MALLLTPVFGVTGCGSDENTQLETEITQLETEITQLETEITQFEARVDALEEQAGSRVTNLTLDPTDDDVQFQSRSKNAAPGIDASGAPSKADCDLERERQKPFLDLQSLVDRLDHPLHLLERVRRVGARLHRQPFVDDQLLVVGLRLAVERLHRLGALGARQARDGGRRDEPARQGQQSDAGEQGQGGKRPKVRPGTKHRGGDADALGDIV